MRSLEVETRRMQSVMMVVLGVIWVPPNAYLLLDGLLQPRLLIALFGAVCLGLYGWLVFTHCRAQVMSVKRFSEDGLLRNDGCWLAWADLGRVVHKMHNDSIWRTEIQFKDGSAAWVIPARTRNFAEVMRLVAGLPCEQAEANAYWG